MWAACDSCHDLILAEERRTLLRRSVNMDPDPEANGATTRINQLHTLFWQNYLYRFEAMSDEELTAEHRLVAFRQGPHAPYQAVVAAVGRRNRRYFTTRPSGAGWIIRAARTGPCSTRRLPSKIVGILQRLMLG
jgi:hypothetical protein